MHQLCSDDATGECGGRAGVCDGGHRRRPQRRGAHDGRQRGPDRARPHAGGRHLCRRQNGAVPVLPLARVRHLVLT